MAEKQSDHRRDWEQKSLKWQSQDMRLGKILGFSLAIIMLAGAIAMAWIGQTVVSMTLVTGPLAGIVTYFRSHGKKKKEIPNGG
jgi:uncharacterized membrane protein